MQEVEIFRTIPERARVSKTGLRKPKGNIVPLPTSHFLSKNFTNLGIFAETFPTEKNLIKAQKKRKKNNGGKEAKASRRREGRGGSVTFLTPKRNLSSALVNQTLEADI